MNPRGVLSCFVFFVMAAFFSLTGGAVSGGYEARQSATAKTNDAFSKASNPAARAYLGIRYETVTPDIAREMHLGAVRGIIIDELVPGSPAVRAGLVEDDVILELDGKPVSNAEEFKQRFETLTPGAQIRLTVINEGRRREVPITLAVPPPDAAQPAPAPATPPAPVTRPAVPLGRGAEVAAPRAAPPSSGTITLRPYSVMDNMIGVEAYRLLVPVGWKVDGGVIWKYSPAAPAALSIRIYNPNGAEEIGAFPDIPCTYSELIARVTPPGQLYQGSEVRWPIEDPIQCLRTMIVPRYQANLRDAAVIAQEELPQVAAAILENNPDLRGGMVTARAGKIRLDYQQSGKAVQEDLYGVVVVAQIQSGTVWVPGEIRYSKAEKGRLEEQYKLFQTIVYSMRPQLEWYNKYQQIAQMMVQSQIDASNRALDLSRYIARVNNSITETIRKSYQDRQSVMDRVNARWDQHIRGVESYQGPFNRGSVELPSGYNEAWTNASGEYVLSNDPNFNPNIGSNANWQRMNKNK